MAPIAQISLLVFFFLVNEFHKAKVKGIKNLMDSYNFFCFTLWLTYSCRMGLGVEEGEEGSPRGVK